MTADHQCDVAIVGAGLAGAMLALALAARHPALDVRLIDADPRIGGNHLWSFFGTDIAAGDRWIVGPVVSHAWRGYDVAFPRHARTLDTNYYSIESSRLDEVVRHRLPARALMLGRAVAEVAPTTVTLADGGRIAAAGVVDARGMADLSTLELGWQKFVGHQLLLEKPHGRPRPMVMDATVAQLDGYRFVYCLPVSAERMFVEDTYYSDSPDLDAATVGARVRDYAAAQGWRAAVTEREETGVLPVAIGGDFDAYWRSGGPTAKVGMRAGLFHPTTGYSLPDAVRLAAAIAEQRAFGAAALRDLTYGHARAAWQARGFYRMLDAMLFRAAEPAERYRVLERFYRLRPSLIGRFYAGQSTVTDKLRILAGKPPVPVGRAIRALARR